MPRTRNRPLFLGLFFAAGIAGLLSASCHSPSPGFLRAHEGQIVNGQGEVVLLRGMGLGGWMLQEGYMFHLGSLGTQRRIRTAFENILGKEGGDQFYEQWLKNHTQKADIDSLAAWGFNSVRLPMHYRLYTLSVGEEPVPGEQTWLEQGFALTDSLLAWCRENRMYLILDLHAAPGGQGNDLNIADRDPRTPSLWESEANREKTIALWRKLAERYAQEEWIGGYDLLNETNWGFEDSTDVHGIREQSNAPLRRLLMDITQAIREVDTNHLIFLEGNGFANNYNGIFPVWDDNLVLSFHKYGNFNTRESIRRFLDLRKKHQIPLWLGESGENSNTWFTEAIELCEKHGIGWAWWQLKKMGINNPLEIPQPEGYEQLLEYVQSPSSHPKQISRERAAEVLEQLLKNLRIENNIFHKDVIDAMFRQVRSYEARPFVPHRATVGSSIQAVDFDLGRQRAAYFDRDSASYHYTPGVHTTGNRGRAYRNDGVDIQPDGKGYHVFHIEDGEWLQYTVEVRETGIGRLLLQVADTTGGGQISIRVDDHTMTNPVPVPHTPTLTAWETVPVEIPELPLGKAAIRIHAEKGGFTLKSLAFSALAP